MKVLLLALTIVASPVFAERAKGKVIYEYKKYEKFDFEEIGVAGETGAPGDVSVSPTPRRDYENRLPERREFNKEIRKAASGIR
jgi:hypothetical protein